MNRRRLLSRLGVSFSASLAGCTSSSTKNTSTNSSPSTETTGNSSQSTETSSVIIEPDELPGEVRPTTDPQSRTEPLECQNEDWTRYSTEFSEDNLVMGDIYKDESPVMSLRVNDTEFTRDDECEITLTNVSDDFVRFSPMEYNLVVLTEVGWQDIRVLIDDDPEYPEELIAMDSTGTRSWTFPLNEDELAFREPYDEFWDVCPSLPTGRYLFVLYGEVTSPIGVSFDLIK